MHFLARAAGAALLLLAGISAPLAATLDIRLWYEPASLDPQKTVFEFQDAILGDLYEGLVTEAADGTIIPGQADSWTVAPDGLTWTFTLRDGIAWTDSQPVVAGDFVYAMRRMVDPATAADFAFLLAPIKNAEAITAKEITDLTQLGVSAPDDRTVVIELGAPMPVFLQALVQFAAYPLPEHAMAGIDFADAAKVVSNGPYKVASWSRGSALSLKRNEGFHDAGAVAVDEVTYHFVADDTVAEAGFRDGSFDIVTRFADLHTPALQAEFGDAVRLVPWLGTQWMPFKLDVPPLDNPKVRLAMSMAIDRDNLGALTGTYQPAAWGFVPPGTPGFTGTPYAPEWAALPYAERLAQAKAAMAAAGYGPEKPLRVMFRHSLRPNRVALAQAVAEMLKQIYIEPEMVAAEIPVHQEAMFQGDFGVAASHWVMDYADGADMLRVLSAGMPVNYGKYANPAFDDLLARAAVEQDPEARFALLHEAEALAVSDVAVVPLYWLASYNLVSPKVTSFVDNVRDVHRVRWLRVED